jgi:predicted AAA+ superfamily ATPase
MFKREIMILRILQKAVQERLFNGKAILIFGPRQCGKSTLVETVLKDKEYLYVSGDDSEIR